MTATIRHTNHRPADPNSKRSQRKREKEKRVKMREMIAEEFKDAQARRKTG